MEFIEDTMFANVLGEYKNEIIFIIILINKNKIIIIHNLFNMLLTYIRVFLIHNIIINKC